jgi:hypothetical protein
MARAKKDEEMTIAELEKILESRRRKVAGLERERGRLRKRLEELDRKISSLNGGRGAGGRAQNAMSLVAAMESALRSAGRPLSVGDILQKVHAAGYRSNSANFRALINQTLIKEKRFVSAGRGIYQLKK